MPPSPLESGLTIPAHALAATTLEPTALGELPPDVLAEAAFDTRYDVGETLGEGGMGIVRACIDKRVGRDIAMKSVKAGTGSRGGSGVRFLREACVQGQLEHPAIVPVYDLGRNPDGTLYFTMKRVRGVTFERIVDALRMGEEDAIRQFTRRKLLGAFASVCHAVDFAHARGVIHRDIKPGNVMLGDFGEVYVLDWGLAKVIGDPDPRLPSGPAIARGSNPGGRTVGGAAMGTPGYMAPEQTRGESVDFRADVYALGAVLFELLALVPLHPHETPQLAMASTRSGVDARPSARSPHLDIPPELDVVCVRATALDPAERFTTVRELVDALERYLDGDRDLARRRDLAREHAAAAAEHARTALAGDTRGAEARARALQEVGRAIALDPTNEDAIGTLMRLMTTPPDHVPPEAQATLEADMKRAMRRGALVGGLAYLTWFGYLPFLLWMGMRSWTAWFIVSGAWLVAAAFGLRAAQVAPKNGEPTKGQWITGVIAIATTSTMFGSYVIVPSLAAMGAMLLHMAPATKHRVPSVILNCLAVVVPAILGSTGVIPTSYVFDGESVRILPVMTYFPPLPTHVFLAFSSLALIVTASVIMARYRNAISRVEVRLHVQAWQLRQLVPETARESAFLLQESTARLPPTSNR